VSVTATTMVTMMIDLMSKDMIILLTPNFIISQNHPLDDKSSNPVPTAL